MAEIPRFSSTSEYQVALEESENRRKLLLQKLQESQKVLGLQSLKLDKTEKEAKEHLKELENINNKEVNYQRYIANLEKQLQANKQRQQELVQILQDAENRLEAESCTYRSAVAQLEGECQKKEARLKAALLRLKEAEDEAASLLVELNSASEKLLSQQDVLLQLREDNIFLDKQAKTSALDAERLRQENVTLFADVKQLRKQVTSLNENSSLALKEHSALISQLEIASEKEKRLKVQLADLQKINSDMKSTIAGFASEKDRYFEERVSLRQQIQNLTCDKERLLNEQLLAEDRCNELVVELREKTCLVEKIAVENERLLEDHAKVLDSISKRKSSEEEFLGGAKKLILPQNDLYGNEIGAVSFDSQKQKMKTEEFCGVTRAEEVETWKKKCFELMSSITRRKEMQSIELSTDDHSPALETHEQKPIEGQQSKFKRMVHNSVSSDSELLLREQEQEHSVRKSDLLHSDCEEIQSKEENSHEILGKKECLDFEMQSTPVENNGRPLERSPITSDYHVPGHDITHLRLTMADFSGERNIPGKTGKGEESSSDAYIFKEILAKHEDVPKLATAGYRESPKTKDNEYSRLNFDLERIVKGLKMGDKSEGITTSLLESVDAKDGKTEAGCNMEIYVCMTDDKDESLFHEGSEAFLVLLPPHADKDLSERDTLGTAQAVPSGLFSDRQYW